jgi:hypothetical protein
MANDAMNSFILSHRRNGAGLMDRLRGTPQLGDDRGDRLNAALAEHEAAQRQHDHIAAQIADEKIEAVLAEARQAADAAEGQAPPAGSGFDGGVRDRRTIAPSPHILQPTAGQLFRQAIAASHAERAARDAA